MRSVGHLTPRYLWHRLVLQLYHRRFPDHPWLTETANSVLSTVLKSTDRGIEFGSGRSTLWIAERVGLLTSVEHDPGWHRSIAESIEQKGLKNVRYLFREKDVPEPTPIDWDERGMESAYVGVIDEFHDESLDFCFVDGIYRGPCALKAINKVRAGGLIVVDNVHFWLPRPTSAFVPVSAPKKFMRSSEDGPASSQWASFQEVVKDWRYIYTSDGTQDTALYFKPCNADSGAVGL